MIQYSSINDAWGNKEMFRKKKPSLLPKINYDTNEKKETVIVEKITNSSTPIETKPVNECNAFEHMMNCPKCLNKIKEKFTQSNIPKYEVYMFGFKIVITKEILQAIFIFLILCIFLLFLSSINQSFKQTEVKYYILPNSFNPTI